MKKFLTESVNKLLPFVLLLLLFSSCSSRDPSETYQAGLKAEAENSFALAIERYEEVVTDYPGEAVAESAMYRLVMVTMNNDGEKPKAIAAQRRYGELFPQSPRVPSMIFMTAFLYNNELNNLDSARTYYEYFLQRYPEHELAPSARFELANLGKEPDELLSGTGHRPQSGNQ